MSTNAESYSENQIMCGLRAVLEDYMGEPDRPIKASTVFVEFLKAELAWEDCDLTDVFLLIEKFFGFKCGDGEWERLFGFDIAKRSQDEWEEQIGMRLTFGSLAQFVAERIEAVSFRPRVVFGRECASAGAFLGIQELMNRRFRRQIRFAPSTRIIDVARGGSLDEFWTQLRWTTENRIPPLPNHWREASCFGAVISFFSVLIGVIAAWRLGNFTWLAVSAQIAVAAFTVALIYKHATNPLPRSVSTFRDLANQIVDSAAKSRI